MWKYSYFLSPPPLVINWIIAKQGLLYSTCMQILMREKNCRVGWVSGPSSLAPLLIYWTVLYNFYLFYQHTYTLNKLHRLDQSHCKAMSPNYFEIPCHLLFTECVLLIIICSDCKLLRWLLPSPILRGSHNANWRFR
jgi:hypothetical protein